MVQLCYPAPNLHATAILGPAASARNLRPFEFPGVGFAIADTLSFTPGCDAALVFGGDGTVHRQLAAAVASQVPLLCVPTGSGNDFARALGLDGVRDALAAWRSFCLGENNLRSVDVADIACQQPATENAKAIAGNQKLETGNLYCCVAGVGLDSEVNRRANRLPFWLRRHGGYVVSLPAALLTFQAPEITLELFESDGAAFVQEPAMMVAFANAPFYGHGMRIAPRARLDDGRIDVCFVRRTSKLRLLRLFPTVFSGSHLALPEVQYAQCSALKIDSAPHLDIFADGEFVGRTPAEVRVRLKALRVIVPRHSPAPGSK